MKKKANKKKKWNKPGLTRVALNSEQAVLSCCDSADRAAVTNGPNFYSQCRIWACPGELHEAISS
ncbi:MAG: hypothetical protein PHP69_07470 [Candidatus Omnitrophica bacterium]|nr:hypothetical protein [Candidatus Omnitrophota bacterium]